MEKLGRFLGAFFGAFLCVVLLMSIYSIAEDITLTTYYPAPYGAYNEMSVTQAVSTNNNTSALVISSTDNNTIAPVIAASTMLDGILLNNTNDATSAHYFLSINSGATSRLYVRNDGNIGINNNAPGYNLDVTGGVNATTYSAGGTAPVADGTYTVGSKLLPAGSNGTITIKGGIITAIQEAT